MEIKFNNQPRDPDQISDYERIAGDPTRVIELDPKECLCNLPEPEPALERARRPVPEYEKKWYEWEYWEEATGLTGADLVLYLIISEGSRLIPARNLVPVP